MPRHSDAQAGVSFTRQIKLKLQQQEDQTANAQGKKPNDDPVGEAKMGLGRVIGGQQRWFYIFAALPADFERKRSHAFC